MCEHIKLRDDYSPEMTQTYYHLDQVPPLFGCGEAVARYQAFLENSYRAIGGICIVDKSEFDSPLSRVLRFHEKADIHLATGALIGPHVIMLPNQKPVINRGIRLFLPTK